MTAPSRRSGPIVVGGRTRAVAGAVLILISTLAALDLGVFAAAARSAGACIARFRDPATVAVTGEGLESADAAAARAREILNGLPGVRRAVSLDPAGCDAGIAEAMGVTTPPGAEIRLLTIERLPAGSARGLEAALRGQKLAARVDDHRWPTSPLARAVATGAGAAAAAALLLCLAAALTCARMTRRMIRANQIAVELLFTAGAEDGLIIGMFRAPALRLGLWAGAVGAAAADALLGVWSRYGSPSPLDALRPLTHRDLLASLAWPLLAGVLAALASGWVTRRTLRALT